jgi:hypothetical protein
LLVIIVLLFPHFTDGLFKGSVVVCVDDQQHLPAGRRCVLCVLDDLLGVAGGANLISATADDVEAAQPKNVRQRSGALARTSLAMVQRR